jgi:acyl carrier protein
VPTWIRQRATLMTMPTHDSSILTREAVTNEIIGLLEKDDKPIDLTADSSLQDHGLDSLKIISIVFKIEEHYDINLYEEYADDLRTVGDLADVVLRCIREQS